MLVLFDIDGTLLRTRGAGVASMERVGREMFGDGFSMDGVEFAGRLDHLIWHDAAARNRIEDPAAHESAFRAAYADAFAAAFDEGATVRVLPGVAALLDALDALGRIEVDLGIVTGNWSETGTEKLRRAGLDPGRFVTAAWGGDGRHRRELPGVAMTRHASATGRAVRPDQVIVVGDTPHDVDCAHHAGCHAIGVTTGPSFDRADLEAAGSDLIVDDLSETDELVDWMVARVS